MIVPSISKMAAFFMKWILQRMRMSFNKKTYYLYAILPIQYIDLS
ncbi:MAG: hypothetical protein JETT_2620 [Candidatus Jettenia ecosi]|uniref:Uncharacterized protein n=1 Tax=Candidatus Jettenia ecosi TaxID=2494326 RepID=A0A533Q9Y8_9BACT|nr:MAG: hypothetical protein JETT_2620 [Candidatus Jettenia ecosi]